MIRKPVIRIELDQWDWNRGRQLRTVDVTDAITQYSFSTSIKNPSGQATFTALPQISGINILDFLNTMDVIRVYEFNILKYQGYIVRVAYSGNMGTGKPQRNCIVTTNAMGNLVASSQLGLNIGQVTKNVATLADSATKLWLAIGNAVADGKSFADLIKVVIDNWFIMITDLGAETYVNYMNTYLDFKTGLIAGHTPVIPKTFDIYNGTEESLTLWQCINQLIEIPLTEIWFDVGNRKVDINTTKGHSLPDNKSYLILRETPFDGSVVGESDSYWENKTIIKISLDYLTRFDLSKSMEEAYSLFGAVPSAFDPGNLYRVLLGQLTYDKKLLNKYLYKPIITQLKFVRSEKVDATDIEKSEHSIESITKDVAETLKAWYQHNDEYLSGVISLHVPEKADDDPRIGQKIEVEGIPGYFYAESVSHQWTYGGNLISSLAVTRGYNEHKIMTLKDRLFTRSIV